MVENKEYWFFDGPGITGMGNNSLSKMETHAKAGGAFVHKVKADGYLEYPERMWPGRGLEGKKVRPDGTIADDADVSMSRR